jgi:hypothetical protein
VETSTYDLSCCSSHRDRSIIEMRYKLRLLGVRLEEQTIMLGDNMSVSSTPLFSSSLKKKHLHAHIIAFIEAIAGKFVVWTRTV